MSSPAVTQTRRAIGRTIRNFRRKPDPRWGIDFLAEVKQRIPHLEGKTIFDVGAHIGMTAIEFSDVYPNAVVHAFEPGAENMRRLEANLVGKPEVRRHKIAFGEEVGSAKLLVEADHPSMARIGGSGGPTEEVRVDTIDNFCAQNGIKQIDLLKIDTEGFELKVLSGAKEMLRKGAIGVLKAECSIDPDSDYHVSLFALCELLHPFGYRLFGIYDQWEDTLAPTPRLRRFDAAFVSPRAL